MSEPIRATKTSVPVQPVAPLHRSQSAAPQVRADGQADFTVASLAIAADTLASTSLESQNQRSSVSDHEVDALNAENARAFEALRSGTVRATPYDWRTSVAAAVSTASPEYRRAMEIEAAARERQAGFDRENKREAEIEKKLPSGAAAFVPIYASAKSSGVHFANKNYGRGIIYGALAISDVFLVKALVLGGGKLVLKGLGQVAVGGIRGAVAPLALRTGEELAAAPKVFLDSTVISDIQRSGAAASRTETQLRALIDSGADVRIPRPAYEEISRGSAEGIAGRHEIIRRLGIPIDEGRGFASRAGAYERYAQEGIRFEGATGAARVQGDLVIGASALAEDAALWTLEHRSTGALQQLGVRLWLPGP